MSEPEDSEHTGDSGSEPEQLLAEALRAQARYAPDAPDAPQPTSGSAAPVATPSVGPPPGYGLLSGADAGSLERERAALDATGPAKQPEQPAKPSEASRRPTRELPAVWVLLLAVLLGLAAGAVVGLLTLL